MCLHSAIRYCSPQPGDADLIEQVAYRHGWDPYWNDDTTDWQAVKDRISTGIEVTDTELVTTFGPQWEHIVTFVRRATVLTGEQATRVVVSRDAAQGAAWNAAHHAAPDADWGAAWRAAESAAAALAMRDLIGHHDFTQQHYDALTEPWATVIGPVHPDDTTPG